MPFRGMGDRFGCVACDEWFCSCDEACRLDVIGQTLEITLVFPAEFQLGCITQLQEIFAITMRSHGRHTMAVNDGRTMYTYEYVRVENVLKMFHRTAQYECVTC